MRGRSRFFVWVVSLSLLCTLTAWYRLDRASRVSGPSFLDHPYSNWDLELKEPFLDDGQACLLPRVHPFDPSVLPYLNQPKPIVCKVRQYPLTLIDSAGRLVFNTTALDDSGYHASHLNCQYRELFRPDGDDFMVGYGPWRTFDPNGIQLKWDFVAVACYNFFGLTVYDYMHAHVLKTEPTSHPPTVLTHVAKGNAYSVFIFGVDSLSRLGVIRHLPKTYQYLTDIMKAYVFRGMTKVGDNTFPNLAAILTGRTLEDLDSGEKEKYYDDWPCIWKNFSSRGYATMYAEDQPHIGLFNYLRNGLKYQPTDHYLRPYWLAVEASTLHRLSSHMCYGGAPKHLLQLNYAQRFISTYQGAPSFGFSFMVELSHDYISKVNVADQDFEGWLRDLNERGHLNRTVLIFMSDHGHRFDAIRATLVGRLEERLPFFALYVPPSLLAEQRHVISTLQTNTGRLTSLFDAHATMMDILALADSNRELGTDQKQNDGKGTSLFRPVPASRTCSDAGIPDHYCICEEESPLPRNDSRALLAANAVVSWLNDVLNVQNLSSLCTTLKLSTVERVDIVRPSRKVQVNSRIYFGKHLEDSIAEGMLSKLRVQLRTEPGKGEFEATVEHRTDENTFSVSREVSRINKYGSQSWCIKDAILRKYCYCHVQQPS